MIMPYDKFVLLTNSKQYLKPDINSEQLNAFSKKRMIMKPLNS